MGSSAMIELLILFAIAVFVLYRLKSVIGTRTGYEAPPERIGGHDAGPQGPRPIPNVSEQTEAEIAAAHANLPEASRHALAGVAQAEPGFSSEEFIEGSRAAYEMILMAYEEGDRQTQRDLLAPDVYDAFESVIAKREAEGLKVDARFIGIRESAIESVAFDQETSEADITVRFVGELITAVRDAENRVVEGDPNEIRKQKDLWTFSRVMGSSSPNWLLTATGA